MDGGLIGTLVLYGATAGDAAVAVLAYRGILLAVPALLGLPALAVLRRRLRTDQHDIAACAPGQEVEVLGKGTVAPFRTRETAWRPDDVAEAMPLEHVVEAQVGGALACRLQVVAAVRNGDHVLRALGQRMRVGCWNSVSSNSRCVVMPAG